MIRMIEMELQRNKKVVVLAQQDSEMLKMMQDMIADNKILNVSIFHNIKSDIYSFVSEEDIETFLSKYYLFEFSDRLIVISNHVQYGSLLNYLNTGLFTKKEIIEALLY